MGAFDWLDGETKIAVGTSITPLYPSVGPTPFERALTRSVFEGADLQTTYNELLVHGIANKVSRYRKYAEEKYYRGLPDVVLNQVSDIGFSVKPFIELDTGLEVTVESAQTGHWNPRFYVQQYAYETLGLDDATGTLSTLSNNMGTTVYVGTLDVVVPDTYDISKYDWKGDISRPTSPFYVPTYPEGRIVYIYYDAEGTRKTDMIRLDLRPFLSTQRHYMASYTYEDNGTQRGFWTYTKGQTPSHDKLNAFIGLDNRHLNPGEYYPTVLFRSQNQDLTDPSHPAYESSVGLCKKLGVDYAYLAAEINKNPDINKVHQAALQMGVPINTEEEAGMAFLYEYFDALIDRFPKAGGPTTLIEDTQLRFKEGADYEYVLLIGSMQQSIEAKVLPGNSKYLAETSANGALKFLYKQVSDTLCRKITISNIRSGFRIYDGKSSWTDLSGDTLLIPLEQGAVERVPPQHKERLLQLSFHLVFNAVEKTQLDWYETEEFAFIMVVVAVVVTIYTLGATIDKLAVAWAAGATAFALAVIEIIVFAIVINAAVGVVSRHVSAELALALAIIAIAWGVAGGTEGLISAERLMMMGTNLTKASAMTSAEAMKQAQRDMNELQYLQEERQEELEAINERLDMYMDLDPMQFVGLQPLIVINETPNSFYNRTIHTGNIGTLCFDAVHHHVDQSLKLPGISDPIGLDIDFTS